MDHVVWITGAAGLIGNYLLQNAPPQTTGWRIRGLTRADCDLTDQASVKRIFEDQKPALIIHCAALSKSVACQENPSLAWKLNVEVTARLADLAADSALIFFSTDMVFDGRLGNYDESATVNPLSVYGETKVAAEHIVLANPKHSVVRTSLNGGISTTGDRGFNEEICRAWQHGRTLNLYTDEFRCPIPAAVTARAVWELALRNQPGLYHLAGSQRFSRWEIGQLLAARWPQLSPKLQPGSLNDYQGAPRSPDTSLNCQKLQRLLSFPLPRLDDWLKQHSDEPF